MLAVINNFFGIFLSAPSKGISSSYNEHPGAINIHGPPAFCVGDNLQLVKRRG